MSNKNDLARSEVHPLVCMPEPSTAILSDKDELFAQARIIQAMSKPENTANPKGADFVRGDVVLSKRKIADLKTPFQIIFLRNSNEWVNFAVINGKKEWRGEDKRTPQNEDLEIKFKHDGQEMERVRQITIYALLPQHIEDFLKDAESSKPTLTGSISPFAIKFLNFNRKAAQEILNVVGGTDFKVKNAIRAQKGLAPIPVYAYQHQISVTNKTNTKGTFQIFNYESSSGISNPKVLEITKMVYEAVQARRTLKTAPEEVEISHEVFKNEDSEL